MNTLQYSKDPADCCLDQSFTSVRPVGFSKEKCPDFMAQRCAREWDSKCDSYLLQLDGYRTGNSFVRETSLKRYCRGSNNNNNSSCVKKCENGMCTSVDEDTYKNPDKLYELSKNFGSLKDDEVSPLKSGECKQECDMLNLSSFGDDDRVLNECLDRGSCGDVMMELSENIVSNNIPYTNRRLKKFIDGYIAQDLNNLQTRVLVGGPGPQITTRAIDTPGPAITLPIKQQPLKPVSPSGFIKSKEGFNMGGEGPSKTAIIIALLFIAFIVGGGYQMYKKYKKY